MSEASKKADALRYHEREPHGKIEVVPTKSVSTQRDLSLAYSPGVAEPCLEIAKDPNNAYKYTAKGNLVAVISNGTAVLGLGNIGALASKPVMEGKGVLFKKFAGIDVFDIEIDETDPEKFIQVVKALEPTFGGVNLEDIKAPESFLIEQTLRREMNIPVMHDDQHGTAIISAAALINALEVAKKDISKVKVVMNGAGAAAISCALLYVEVGVRKENLVMLDSKGVIKPGREGLDPSKAQFANDKTKATDLAEALVGADVFIGLSKGNVMSAEMLKTMAGKPIVFALANPDPEIDYELAMDTRDDIIMATGRSDHPNQVNNVLGFPYIFRGALDVRATEINEAMKLAAVKALAEMTKETVPEFVAKAYGKSSITFGADYLIPKPIDPRLITRISPAVAKAAQESGVAQIQITDWEGYELALKKRLGIDDKLITRMITIAKTDPRRVVFAEGDQPAIQRAAQLLVQEGIARPILIGKPEMIRQIAEEHGYDMTGIEMIDHISERAKREEFGRVLYERRKRKGVTHAEGRELMRERNYYAAMMVEVGEADAMLSGYSRDYPSTVVPALQVIGVEEGINRVAGMYILTTKKGTFFLADTTLNLDPTAEQLVDITTITARAVKFFGVEPRIAMLSHANFGSAQNPSARKVAKATQLLKEKFPDLVVEGELQANFAIRPDLQHEIYPFSTLAEEGANTLIFPNLDSGNIAYKLLQELGGAEAIGPVLLGMAKAVHVIQRGAAVREIVNLAAIAVVDAQTQETGGL